MEHSCWTGERLLDISPECSTWNVPHVSGVSRSVARFPCRTLQEAPLKDVCCMSIPSRSAINHAHPVGAGPFWGEDFSPPKRNAKLSAQPIHMQCALCFTRNTPPSDHSQTSHEPAALNSLKNSRIRKIQELRRSSGLCFLRPPTPTRSP